MKLLKILTGAFLAAAIAPNALPNEVRLSDLPSPIRTTIQNNARGGTIKKVEQHTRNGKTSYTVTVNGQMGTSQTFNVGTDGKFMGADNRVQVLAPTTTTSSSSSASTDPRRQPISQNGRPRGSSPK